ncbi:hypothetical protein BV22DRAFT_1123058 [Leucogyrophana mollusca]|uniref:Uncharacterized protein n=1 Tax=Leucogyrophana mollusca TaxID=85980 RepID=A0ACB8B4E5_9AGAM|nr:hypothetical protein BV22DRAFT_1123058 [Leucogyrophana mollusca]
MGHHCAYRDDSTVCQKTAKSSCVGKHFWYCKIHTDKVYIKGKECASCVNARAADERKAKEAKEKAAKEKAAKDAKEKEAKEAKARAAKEKAAKEAKEKAAKERAAKEAAKKGKK